ncbi:MAG TPA: TlpA disulfide reductase family protein [Bacteroidota bacterium]|nr:TlpA disulfide reductase family protein [Bacteroidota bacterium]
MEQTRKKFKWIEIISITLNFLLTAEAVLLILQNRDLKNLVKSMSMVSQVEPLKPGERVEAVQIQTLDGNTTELTYTDTTKKYLLFVLSTTCPHCEKTLVNWKAIAQNNRDHRCDIIGVSLHHLDETKKYIANKDVSFYLVSAADTSFSRKYKISGVPETILLKGDGSVEKVWVGELSEEQTREIENLMGA